MARSNRWDRRPMDFVRRLIVFVLAAMLPVVTYALTTTPNTYNWHGSRMGGVTGVTPGMAPTRATFRVSVPGQPSTYVGKSFGTSFGTLGKLGKGALGGLGKLVPYYNAYVLTKAVIDGAGWAINELQHQVTEGGAPAAQVQPLGYYHSCVNQKTGGNINSLSQIAARDRCVVKFLEYVNGELVSIGYKDTSGNVTRFNMVYKPKGGSQTSGTTINVAYVQNTTGQVLTTTDIPGTAVSDEQLGEKLAAAGPETVDALLMQDGKVMMTPELVAAMNELTAALEAQKGLTPSEPATVDPDFAQSPEQQPAQEKEWPGFCDWATPVCEFIDWMKKDQTKEAVEVPYKEEQLESKTWNSGLASDASCPAPIALSLGFGGHMQAVEVSFQPLCEFARGMRLIVISVGLFSAGLILVGLRNG